MTPEEMVSFAKPHYQMGLKQFGGLDNARNELLCANYWLLMALCAKLGINVQSEVER